MKRETLHLTARYVICFVGISIMALGVALTTKANLGTTPISALPYIASLGFASSIGFFTGLLNVILVFAQIAVLGKRFPRLQWMQIPVSCLFGFFIDVWMHALPDFTLVPYATKLSVLATATVILALGIFLEVSADVVMMAGEGAVKTLALLLRKDFGVLKVVFDISLVVLAGLLSLYLFNDLKGIGEGTLISAACVGLGVKGLRTLRRVARLG